jgi:hypothetical protein
MRKQEYILCIIYCYEFLHRVICRNQVQVIDLNHTRQRIRISFQFHPAALKMLFIYNVTCY